MSSIKIRVRPSVVRAVVLAVLIVAQLWLMAWTLWTSSEISVYIDMALSVVSLLVVLYIVKSNTDPSYKLIWSILILLAPVFGGPFYLFFGLQPSSRRLGRRIAALGAASRPFLEQGAEALEAVAAMRDDFGRQARYLASTAGFPVYGASRSEYLTSGEAKFERLKSELSKAERFIFLEYFIIEEGLMWDSILEILAEKARSGLDVRVMYDDIGCLFTLPADYKRTLEAKGVRCAVFNPARAFPSTLLNHRDHRKIVVVDGRVAFTGGVNLADEYINRIDKYGHWKDAAVIVSGDAVSSLTVMFLNMWNLQSGASEDYRAFLRPASAERGRGGYVQPYADSPMDFENVGASVYLNIINAARRYVYITTPYLIVDHTIMTALCLAAKSGVDVRIITPRHWDKRYVHMTTRSYYDELVSAGVKVFEYVDGFMHAKTFVSDDAIAVVGTTNLDFRSLYLHYECGAVLYGGPAVGAVRDDFERTLERCDPVAPGEYRPRTLAGRVLLQALRLFAPLL
ncbi:MAG: cardiolipin synthase [Spirochaetes bacterium]|nr:cardiolipin synthase [Spirochaetota bacterium]MBU1079971.1 cardiolipin synthase [Spirochaetota bacterium]